MVASGTSFVRPANGQDVSLRLKDAAPGSYYLRVLTESGAGNGEEDLNLDVPFLYHNGHPVDFARATATMPFQKTNVAVIESRDPIPIAPGDELRWNSVNRGGRLLGGVALAQKPLASAPVDIRPLYDPDLHDEYRLRGEIRFDDPDVAKSTHGNFKCDLRNLAGKPMNFDLEIEVRDYWQRVLAKRTEQPNVADRATFTVNLPFDLGDSDRYRAIVRVKSADGLVREKVYEKLVDNPRGGRPRLWLNEGWEWTSLKDNGTAATRVIGDAASAASLTGWKSVNLPAAWTDTNPKDNLAWYRRKFVVPPWLQGHRLFLHFTRVATEARVFLNGKEIASHFSPSGSFELEITGVQPGENELLLGVRGVIATLVPEELATRNIEISKRSRFRAPLYTPGVGEIWLYGTGADPVRDVFVKTSYRKKNIELEIEAPKLPPGTKAILTNRILSEGNEVLSFPDVPIDGERKEPVSIKQDWEHPILWNPGDPKLLQLVTELKSPDGQVLDRVDTRFGFREFWPEGKNLVWNGVPVKLAGVPFLSTWSWGVTERSKRDFSRNYILQAKRLGVTILRHVYDPEYRAEMQDEEGLVYAQAVGGTPSQPTTQKVESDEFWENCNRFTADAVKGLRNHPSIVTWYLSNEFSAADDEPNRKRLESVGRTVLKLDDTRIIEFGCDLDLGGFAPVISTHYPVDVGAVREERGLFPEAAYWHLFGTPPLRAGDKAPAGIAHRVANVHGDAPILWGEKPIVINESMWIGFFLPPDGLTRFAGDGVYTSATAVEQAFKEANRWFVRGHRDAEASVITPWEWVNRDPMGLEFPVVEINPIQRYEHFYGGEQMTFDVNLHNDQPRAAHMNFSWSLSQDGREIGGENHPIDFTPADLKREQIKVALPEVKKRTNSDLVFRLTENGKEIRKVILPVNIYPREPITFPAGLHIGLYDPQGNTRKAIASFQGPAPVELQKLDEASLKGLQALIIGENAGQSDDPAARRAMSDFVERGGRVLLLAQEKPPTVLPFSLVPTQLVSSRMWSFCPGDAVLRDLAGEDFANWFPLHRTGGNFYLKPESGGFRTLLESGGPQGMVYSGLLERPVGAGLVIASQLDLIANLDRNPIAAKLWRNLLACLAQRPPEPSKVGFWGDVDGAFYRQIAKLGAELPVVHSPADLKSLNVVILDGGATLAEVDTRALRDFVTAGGRLLAHGVTPENKATMEAISGGTVNVNKPGPPAWDGRAIRVASSDLINGITNYDLFWKRRPDFEDYAGIFSSDKFTLAPLGSWVLDVPGGRALLYPAYLAEMSLGKGRILFDNLSWGQSSVLVRAHTRRLGSALLANLGVPTKSVRPVEIPANLTYEPVDLTGVMNRSFTDEVADDGKGGWTDQGPNSDLRTFPTDQPIQTLKGVPYRIEKGNSIVVLASQFRPAGPPKSVVLPIQGKADVLFFLESSAWTSARPQASYTVNYTDGSKYEIQLAGNVNMRDWSAANADEPFAFETDTVTKVAWSGTSRTFPKVSLFSVAWPNPHPERDIRDVTFQSANLGVPILVAVTRGIKQASALVAPIVAVAGETAESRRLVEEGRSLMREGKAEQGLAKFQAAAAISPGWEAPLLEKIYYFEKKRDWKSVVAACEDLIKISPQNLEVMFRLAKAQEELRDWDGAERTYRLLIKINPNQPEVMSALTELPKKKGPSAAP